MNQESGPEYFGRDLEAMSCAANYHRLIRNELRPYVCGRIAEVGAGTGSFTDFLLELPLEHIDAYEPSVNMYPLLRSRHGMNPRVSLYNAMLSEAVNETEGKYDAVVYINVLEHIEDDLNEIEVAMQTLKPNGHLVIFVPALPFLFSRLDKQLGHYRRYLRRELSQLIQRAGCHEKENRYFDILGILPWFMVYKVLGRQMLSSQVSLYDRYIVPFGRKLEGVISPPIGKNILAVVAKQASTDNGPLGVDKG